MLDISLTGTWTAHVSQLPISTQAGAYVWCTLQQSSVLPAASLVSEAERSVAAVTFKKLHKNVYVSDADLMTGMDEETEARLTNTKLWSVIALCALSSLARGKLDVLYSAAMEEDRLAKRLRAVTDHMDCITVNLSTLTKFGCLLLTNIPELQV